MFLAFAISFVTLFSLMRWRRNLHRETWALVLAFACLLCLLLAYVTVSSVWTPNSLSDDIFRSQNNQGDYEGTFPFSKLSYPLFVEVYHTPFALQEIVGRVANGQVSFKFFLANAKIAEVNGTFSYDAYIMGPVPLNYRIDFLTPSSPSFFGFLLALFAFFNIIGSLIGIVLAKILYKRIERQDSEPSTK